jgi:hypothetical protein
MGEETGGRLARPPVFWLFNDVIISTGVRLL